jgi:4-hydroxybenzoate polyprenyltransferase
VYRGLLRACHPEPALAVTVIATVLAVVVGRGATGVAVVTATVLATQLCIGWSNDWLDAERDALVGRSDKPVASGQVSRRAVGLAALVAGVLSVPLALLSRWPAAVAILIALVGGLAYNWPLKFTAASPVPYLISFGALPGYVVLGRPAAPPWWLVTAGALLGGGAHFANVLPDLADDARTGVHGLPHRLGATGSSAVGAVLLLAATAVLVFGPPGPPSWAGLATLAAAVVVPMIGWYAARRGGFRAIFRAVIAVAVADVVLLLVSGTGV